MEKNKTLHAIATGAPLDGALGFIKNNMMVTLRGYLNPNNEDNALLRRLGHTLRQAIELTLSERNRNYCCPHCGSKELDYDKGNGGDQVKDADGNEYQIYSAVCKHCGKTVNLTARYIGILSEEELRSLEKNVLTSPFADDEMEKGNPFEILMHIRAVKPESIKKAEGTTLSINEDNDVTFNDILLASDGTLLCQFRWEDDKEYDVVELSEIADRDLWRIIEKIR